MRIMMIKQINKWIIWMITLPPRFMVIKNNNDRNKDKKLTIIMIIIVMLIILISKTLLRWCKSEKCNIACASRTWES